MTNRKEEKDKKMANDDAARLRRKNMAVGLTIVAFIIVLYFVSYIRISSL